MGKEEQRVRIHKNTTIKELELMREAIGSGDYKEPMHHKIIANIAIDEMVNVSKMTKTES